jgi:hypothetical protein
MDSPLQIETSMTGTKAKVINPFVVNLVSWRFPTNAAADELRLNLRIKDASAARDPCHLAVAQDGKLR